MTIDTLKEYLEKEKNISTISNSQKKYLRAYIKSRSKEDWEVICRLLKRVIELDFSDRKVIDSFLVDETETYTLENFEEIDSVVMNFDFFIQEKWRIASDKPGSGNTKNIGSDSNIVNLKSGNGLFVREFTSKAKNVFDLYWTTYETSDLARKLGREPLFNDVKSFIEHIKSSSELIK